MTAILMSRLVGRRHIGTVDCQVFREEGVFGCFRFIGLGHRGRALVAHGSAFGGSLDFIYSVWFNGKKGELSPARPGDVCKEMFAKIRDVCGKLVLAFQAYRHAPSSIHQGIFYFFSRRTTSQEKGESEFGKGVGIDRKEAASWQQPIGFVKRGEKFSLTKASSIKNFHRTKAV